MNSNKIITSSNSAGKCRLQWAPKLRNMAAGHCLSEMLKKWQRIAKIRKESSESST